MAGVTVVSMVVPMACAQDVEKLECQLLWHSRQQQQQQQHIPQKLVHWLQAWPRHTSKR